MAKRKSKLESLSSEQIEEITAHSEKRKDVPLIKSSQVNMRLSDEILKKAKSLAKAQKVPYTTFLTKLLKEDIERLWSVFKGAR
ncbi:MAG: hypothetical protein H6622_00410 [Halobacteriovoraceae bacterium]|nr:hypothetical protein [Halobacteriovoraceae bacterium]